ncbi:hypothetical protein [Muricoccus vinaceus]|uniref:Uncharacterized protein n=1 Tax=Muricoccus vinaceus TaxID=424704 RepID=A0ABV6ILV1_9PROT
MATNALPSTKDLLLAQASRDALQAARDEKVDQMFAEIREYFAGRMTPPVPVPTGDTFPTIAA